MPSIGVVGATGAVGGVLCGILRERGLDDVRFFASARSAGGELDGHVVEEATPEALAGAGVDVFFFAIGATASRELVPHAVLGSSVVLDKSSAWRMEPNVPLVVPEVNPERALEHQGIIAVPNCSTIPLTCVLKPLHDAAGIARVRVATYQSVSGAGDAAVQRLRETSTADADLAMDWAPEGDAGELSEEYKLREETRKILALPELPLHASCMRVPVMVGHAQAVWLETDSPLSPAEAEAVLREAPSVALDEAPTPGRVAGTDLVHVGRIRRDPTTPTGLALLIVNDNLRKGAALNAVQILEGLLARRLLGAGTNEL
jgi:aspartate-semialdehyde dehydrogenase